MFGNAHSPEKCLCGSSRALDADFFLLTSDEKQETFPPIFTGRYWFLEKIFFTPQTLASVDHDLCLSAESKEENRRREYYSVSRPYRFIDLDISSS